MKGWKLVSCIMLIVVAFSTAAVFLYVRTNTFSVNTMFAEKATLVYETDTIEINKDDLALLKEIFNVRAYKDSPACPFGGITVTLSSDNQFISLYPAGDECDTVFVEHQEESYYFQLGEENKTMREILEKYGVVWPAV